MLTRENVLRLWASEEYKKLSRRLIAQSSGDSLQYTHIRSNITDPNKVTIDDIEYGVDEVIQFLNRSMKTFKTLKDRESKYYRGDSNLLPDKSCLKENYISVSKHLEDAVSFIDDPKKSYLSEVTIDPDVKCIQVGVEGELLLQHGCFWEVKSLNPSFKTIDGVKYKTLKVRSHPPSKKLGYLECSLLKKRLSKSESPISNKSKKLNKRAVAKRLGPFYETYVEEAQLLSESVSESRFMNTVRDIQNISNQRKRTFFGKATSKVKSNSNSRSNSRSK
jgi:hypothetical protein